MPGRQTARRAAKGHAEPAAVSASTRLKQAAQRLAEKPYQPPPQNLPEPIAHLTGTRCKRFGSKDSHALWRDDGLEFRVRFFHLGLYNKVPVKMYEVADGQARQLAYDPALFDYGASGVDGRSCRPAWASPAFSWPSTPTGGATSPRFKAPAISAPSATPGSTAMSAQGLAIDCGLSAPEEFPIFTAFWLERPAADADRLTIYALLDSPSADGGLSI